MWLGWSVGCYGLYILEGGSSELLRQVDPVGPAVICALGWLGLVEVGAGLLAFIQLMWVTHPRTPVHCGTKFLLAFHNLAQKVT